MTGARMHADEVPTDVGLVRRLLAAQFPQWADLPITPVPSAGTDNAIYRLGEDKAVRLPRIHWATGQIAKERTWLPRLAPYLTLELPAQLAVGAPDAGYPYEWGVYRWLAGESVADASIVSLEETAVALFSGPSRQTFRDALAVDDATWARARGQALSQAVIFIPYYLHTNPLGVARAQRMLREVLADPW